MKTRLEGRERQRINASETQREREREREEEFPQLLSETFSIKTMGDDVDASTESEKGRERNPQKQ